MKAISRTNRSYVYYKVILPKKRPEDTDDIEDFELEEIENEEISD